MSRLDKLVKQSTASKVSWVRFQENIKKDWGLAGTDTGIHDLNLAIGGVMPTEVVTVAARSGVGKTALMTPLLKAATRYESSKPEFIFFTWEMSPDKLVDRMISFDTGLSAKDLIMGARLLKQDEIEAVKNSIESGKDIAVSYHPRSTDIEEVIITFEEFKESCDKKTALDGIRRHPIGIIDYIGLAELDGAGVRTYGINDFYRGLKQCANRTGGSWVVLAQIARGADKKDLPDRGDLSDSQSIENNSDVLCILHRPEYLGQHRMIDPVSREEIDSKGRMLFRVLKCRMFGPSEFITCCDMSRYKFWSVDLGMDYPYWEMYKDENFWRSHFGYESKEQSASSIENQADIFNEESGL